LRQNPFNADPEKTSMQTRFRHAAVAIALLACTVIASAQTASHADCERDYRPKVGQSGKDVIWVPTPDELVTRMLEMAKTTAKDYVIDLGAGDGKIAIAAAKQFGATALGIEYNPAMVKFAQCLVQAEAVADKAKVIQGDVFVEDFSKATVLSMYLLPELNLRLRPTILKMKPGTRVVSHQFSMGDWTPDQVHDNNFQTAYLWIVPANVAGTWNFKEPGGIGFSVNLVQSFQEIGGEAMVGTKTHPLVGAALRVDEVQFGFTDEKGVVRHLRGKVRGDEFSGALRIADGELKITGSRK
jgi:hypothetical protein